MGFLTLRTCTVFSSEVTYAKVRNLTGRAMLGDTTVTVKLQDMQGGGGQKGEGVYHMSDTCLLYTPN
jgi:hypothetical protein